MEYKNVDNASIDAQEHIDNGNVVAFHDDIKDFAESIGISQDDIEIVER